MGDVTQGGEGGAGSSGGPDAPSGGDDSGSVRDSPEELDGPLCPPCDPKQICCALTGKCYLAGCGSCCM